MSNAPTQDNENTGFQHYKKWQLKRKEVTEKVKEQIADSPGPKISDFSTKKIPLKKQLEDFVGIQRSAKSVSQKNPEIIQGRIRESAKKLQNEKPSSKSKFDDILNNYFSAIQSQSTNSPKKEKTNIPLLSSIPGVRKITPLTSGSNQDNLNENRIKKMMSNMKTAISVKTSPEKNNSPSRLLNKSPILKFKEQFDLEKQRTNYPTVENSRIDFPMTTRANPTAGSIFPNRRSGNNIFKFDNPRIDLKEPILPSRQVLSAMQTNREKQNQNLETSFRPSTSINGIVKITSSIILAFQQKIDGLSQDDWQDMSSSTQEKLRNLANGILAKLKSISSVKMAF